MALLEANQAIRELEQLRFRSIMVDEFQDTNKLQTDLIDLLCAGPAKELFFVGDEFQSIYGFRHADVAVFRDRREAAPHVLPLTLNYRSRPEVLAAVNELFDDEFGESFQRARRRPTATATRSSGRPSSCSSPTRRPTPTRASTGAAPRRGTSPGACASSSTRAPRRPARSSSSSPPAPTPSGSRRSCARVDLPTIRMTGRRYFGQQQVVDLLSYLRLLQNRYDDEALLTVLASPFVGVSNDALVLIRASAEKRPIFKGIERTLPGDLAEDDRRLVRAFLQRYERLVESSTRLSLELLCERILVEHDYDLAVLARRDGQRRYANLRKLARLARSYEELRGPDIEGFIRFVAEQDAVGAPERDAVSEEEGADAVRLLTIHAAKGLEFKVVVVADAGRERSRTDEILCLSDGRFGFKVAHPGTGSRVSTTSYQDGQGDAGPGRGGRAAASLLRRDDAGDGPADRLGLGRPARASATSERRSAGCSAGSGSARSSTARTRRCRSRWSGGTRPSCCGSTVSTPDAAAPQSLETAEAAARRGGGPARALRGSRRGDPRRPRQGCASSSRSRRRRPPSSPGSPTARSRSSTAAATATTPSGSPACSRRPGSRVGTATEMATLGSIRPRSATRCTGCSSWSTCERRWRPTPDEIAALVGAWYPGVSEDELARIDDFVRAYTGSALAARIAGLEGVRPERPFAFELDGVLVNGRLDVLWLEGERALVLDYKTNALLGRDPAEIVEEEYVTQQIVYAIACLRAGAREVEVVYHFLEEPDAVVSSDLHGRGCAASRGGPLGLDRPHPGGGVPPDAEPFACSGCPALDVVCAGPRLGGVGEPEPEYAWTQ